MRRPIATCAMLFLVVVATTACHQMTSPTRALTAAVRASADTLAIEMAVAEQFKAWLTGKNVTLDSRFGGQGNDERPSARTQEFARILGVPVAHSEDVFGCRANCPPLGEQYETITHIIEQELGPSKS
jgi:hypothetical protein